MKRENQKQKKTKDNTHNYDTDIWSIVRILLNCISCFLDCFKYVHATCRPIAVFISVFNDGQD